MRYFLKTAVGVVGFMTFLPLLFAQPSNNLKDQLVGSWTLTYLRASMPDGRTVEPYGANAKGTLMFDRNGRFALILIDPSIPQYRSNNRAQPTAEEAMAVAKGSFSFFGTYVVDDAKKSFVFKIEWSSYPNFNGQQQHRTVKSITQSELRFANETSPGSSVVTELLYRRE